MTRHVRCGARLSCHAGGRRGRTSAILFSPARQCRLRRGAATGTAATQYCNRYCYREIDGHHYCQRRLREAGTQAPPPVGVDARGSPVYRQGRP